jgi:hypothetical protein
VADLLHWHELPESFAPTIQKRQHFINVTAAHFIFLVHHHHHK